MLCQLKISTWPRFGLGALALLVCLSTTSLYADNFVPTSLPYTGSIDRLMDTDGNTLYSLAEIKTALANIPRRSESTIPSFLDLMPARAVASAAYMAIDEKRLGPRTMTALQVADFLMQLPAPALLEVILAMQHHAQFYLGNVDKLLPILVQQLFEKAPTIAQNLITHASIMEPGIFCYIFLDGDDANINDALDVALQLHPPQLLAILTPINRLRFSDAVIVDFLTALSPEYEARFGSENTEEASHSVYTGIIKQDLSTSYLFAEAIWHADPSRQAFAALLENITLDERKQDNSPEAKLKARLNKLFWRRNDHRTLQIEIVTELAEKELITAVTAEKVLAWLRPFNAVSPKTPNTSSTAR